ncbi:ribonuclease Z, mitochondrial [Frieseomelitta varia]|uniref:ribonuclease Z, mitochondrial n=1 Tax=Frieseomelitta varia TaxID=561572 RepID=UPI001CB6A76E|nr:ribonuclease Z, mitochondrial [Frieseomelitta varia]
MFQFSTCLFKFITKNIHIIKAHNRLLSESSVINLAVMQQKKEFKHFNAYLKVLGSGALGTPQCVFFMTDHSNYIFNCGESTQRLSQEHGCKLSKIENIFVTHFSWKNIGGIPGLLLTVQSSGTTEINIHCPEGVRDFIEAVKSFVFLPKLKISYFTIDESAEYNDCRMKVSYVPITKSTKNIKKLSSDLVDQEQYYTNENDKRVINEETDKEKVKEGKKLKSIPKVICYICTVHSRSGKLLIDKCINFGVPPGPLLDKLKQGMDITKPDGSVVYSKDVVSPDIPETTFIVVECPTDEYLDPIVNHPAFLKYQQTETEANENKVFCIFHCTSDQIFTNQRYQDWLRKFSSNTQHVIVNSENTCMGSEAVYKNQSLLNMLHPEIFPLLSKDRFDKDKETLNDNIYRARTGQVIEIRPMPKPLQNAEIYKDTQIYIDDLLQLPDFTTVLKELKAVIKEKSVEHNLNTIPDYPRIVMLGTGCSVPNKVRNTSGILLRVNKDCSILLDCGEGTLGQIIRFYGVSEGLNILRTIKAIYVSHMHADHHLGFIGLLSVRKKVTDEKLYLLAPKILTPWYEFCDDQFNSIKEQYISINNNNLYFQHHNLSSVLKSMIFKKLNVKDISTIYVLHCKQSYGVAITLEDNKKIVYSGDTIFCQRLIDLGQNCDLLIHEATMENGLEQLAYSKSHSTTSQAIKAGKSMNAKFILLTHFSQRYSKIPFIPEEKNVGLAYDNMEFKLPQLPLLPLFYPCIKVMFSEYNKVLSK